jgi:hypothetical protein
LCPACGEIMEFLEFVGCESWRGHRPSCPEVAS